MKIYPMKRNLHFFGKWQNLENCQLLGMGIFEGIVQYMKVTLVYENHFAHNKVSLASKLP